MTTVICLDDFHSNDRAGRKVTGLTALDPRENNFDLMYEQVRACPSTLPLFMATRIALEKSSVPLFPSRSLLN